MERDSVPHMDLVFLSPELAPQIGTWVRVPPASTRDWAQQLEAIEVAQCGLQRRRDREVSPRRQLLKMMRVVPRG